MRSARYVASLKSSLLNPRLALLPPSTLRSPVSSSPLNPRRHLSDKTRVMAQSKSSMDYPILAQMLKMNGQWSQDVDRLDPGFFTQSAKGQAPKVLWIGCSDSRVPESVVLASKPGDVFVTRNIANQFHPNDDSVNSVLAFAVEELGVQHVVVVGHTNCGGAAYCHGVASNPPDAAEANGVVETPLDRWLVPLIGLARKMHEQTKSLPKAEALVGLVEANVKAQLHNVTQSDVIKRVWGAKKQVYVHGWVYELETGHLRDLAITQGPN